MKKFKPHFEILPEEQKALWAKLSPCKDLGFVLYGGTAIALRLGHRRSVDFDFFSHVPLDATREKELTSKLPFLKSAKLIQHEENTYSYLTPTKVQLSFFGGIRLGRIGEPQNTQDGVLQVASLEDLMAIKLATVLQRVAAKDYKDISAMLQNGMDLKQGMAGAMALYGRQFLPSESAKALTYFEGGDLQELSKEDRRMLLHATQKFSLKELPQILRVSDFLTNVSDQKQSLTPKLFLCEH